MQVLLVGSFDWPFPWATSAAGWFGHCCLFLLGPPAQGEARRAEGDSVRSSALQGDPPHGGAPVPGQWAVVLAVDPGPCSRIRRVRHPTAVPVKLSPLPSRGLAGKRGTCSGRLVG